VVDADAREENLLIVASRLQAKGSKLMQKLVTIYLDNSAYGKGKMLVGSYADKHGLVEEHLQQYIAQGWMIISIHGFGAGEGLSVRGWVTVLLEKGNA